VWAGFFGGAGLLAGVHVWIGYGIFVAFCLVAALVYIRFGSPRRKPV
jgi:hypothetical protein